LNLPVSAVFENLLPDVDDIRRRVAEKTGASGIDAYSLLSTIGKDCVGALQFITENHLNKLNDSTSIHAESVKDSDIEGYLKNLSSAPLGIQNEDDFRISVAGAQEKTAFLWHNNQWKRPNGTTPTTHIFKTQIGTLPNGIDLSNSVENEFYCLKLFEAFGFIVNQPQMLKFGETKCLVLERFDRMWTKEGRLLRKPQEDLCQALSIPPTRKYQNEGGVGIVDIIQLLKGSDFPLLDQYTFLKAQILFWAIGATDGHAKNFSLHLGPSGSFKLTPLYDILTTQLSLDKNQIRRNQFKMAMSVGDSKHYKINNIVGRHFIETALSSGLHKNLIKTALYTITEQRTSAFEYLQHQLPKDFPEEIHESVYKAATKRLQQLEESL